MLTSLEVAEAGKFSMMLWALWRHRNNILWRQEDKGVSYIIFGALGLLCDWLRANVENFVGDSVLNKEQQCANWHCPPRQLFKCNVDVAFFNDTNYIAVDGEAMRMVEALSWIRDKGFKNVIVETDANYVVWKLEIRKRKGKFGLEIAWEFLKEELEVVIRFVRRRANGVAHSLARAAHSQARLVEFCEPPSYVIPLLSDICTVCN
ncbi:hypothetical protein PTKIN_Ptkin13bG0209900 [Pterospermum kingtungense]